MAHRRARRLRRSLGAVSTTVALLLAGRPATTSAPAVGEWPTVRHDARNTAYTPVEVVPPLRLAWRVRLGGGLQPPLLFSGGVVCASVYRSQNHTDAVLLDARGRTAWTATDAVPLYLSGRRLVVRADGTGGAFVHCYDWQAPRLVWSHSLGPIGRGYPPDSANASGGLLYHTFASVHPPYQQGPAALKVLRLADGTVAASTHFPEGWWEGPPALGGGHVYWGVSHWFRVLDAQTLKPQWANYEGGNACPLVLAPGRVLVRGWGHGAEVWDVAAGKPVWWYRAWRSCAPCLARGARGKRVLVDSLVTPPGIAGLDPATGKVLWCDPQRAGDYGQEGALAGSGRLAYAVARDVAAQHRGIRMGGFYCYQARSGRLLWKYERRNLDGVAVIVAGGSVYGLGSDGYLYRFVPVAGQRARQVRRGDRR